MGLKDIKGKIKMKKGNEKDNSKIDKDTIELILRLYEIEKEVIESGDIDSIIDLADFEGTLGYNVDRLQTVIIDIAKKNDNADPLYRFAKDVKGANVTVLEDSLMDVCRWTKDYQKLYEFARDVKGANIEKLEDEFLGICCYSILNPPLKEIVPKVRHTEKKQLLCMDHIVFYYFYKFARDVKGANIEKIKEKFTTFYYGNPMENADLNLFTNANLNFITRDIKGVNKEKMQKSIDKHRRERDKREEAKIEAKREEEMQRQEASFDKDQDLTL